jgi:hypothetical protein
LSFFEVLRNVNLQLNFCMLKFITTMITPPSDDRRGWKYVQQETRHVMTHLVFQDLLAVIKRHRDAHDLDLSPGWMQRVEAEMCLYNNSECDDPENPQPYKSALEKEGRKLWKELHDKGASLPESLTFQQQEDLRGWLENWELRVPSWGGCACRDHYFEIKTRIPPTFDSGRAFERWTISLHDAVNERLGKPLWGQQ